MLHFIINRYFLEPQQLGNATYKESSNLKVKPNTLNFTNNGKENIASFPIHPAVASQIENIVYSTGSSTDNISGNLPDVITQIQNYH